MDPDLAQLRALAAAIDEGSFEAAATSLHLTPSAVSQRIKALETSVGQVLVRRTKPTATTDAGEAYLRLARQIDSLVRAAGRLSGPDSPDAFVTVPLAVNSDSLATWVLPALADIPAAVAFDLHREDQDHSAELLRTGTVMAAITTDSGAVQGCTVERLGVMRYRALASPGFVAKWFRGGAGIDALRLAPAQPGREDVPRRPCVPLDAVEAVDAEGELPDDEERPLLADHGEGRGDRAAAGNGLRFEHVEQCATAG